MKIFAIAIMVMIGVVHLTGCSSLKPYSTEHIVSMGERVPFDVRYGE